MNATTIEKQADLVTLINVFEVAPERQTELVEVLDRATIDVMRHLPGFISANIHVGLDGRHVANYAQWASVEDFQNMLQNPEARVHMGAAAAMAEYAPALYRVGSVHSVPTPSEQVRC